MLTPPLAVDHTAHLIALAAGSLRAEQVYLDNGWRKCPAQCSILLDLLRGQDHASCMSLMDSWLLGYRATCKAHDDQLTAALFI